MPTAESAPGPAHLLANFNVARMRFERLEDPGMHGFASRLAEINAAAEDSPGFVWRLQTDEGDATAIRPYEDDRILINLSLWESVEALEQFVYRTAHGDLVRQGRNWFERTADATLVLWWIPAGEHPTLADAVERLDRLRREGPSADAFTFAERWPRPD